MGYFRGLDCILTFRNQLCTLVVWETRWRMDLDSSWNSKRPQPPRSFKHAVGCLINATKTTTEEWYLTKWSERDRKRRRRKPKWSPNTSSCSWVLLSKRSSSLLNTTRSSRRRRGRRERNKWNSMQLTTRESSVRIRDMVGERTSLRMETPTKDSLRKTSWRVGAFTFSAVLSQ